MAAERSIIRWLLKSDPAIRWQVLRDLGDERAGVVAAERSRIGVEGWGARVLSLQGADGNWGGGPWVRQSWASTMETLTILREFGLDPSRAETRRSVGLVAERVDWGPYHGHSPFFEGESEPCIKGRVLACGAYFGFASDRLVERLLGEHLADGGWNCDAPPSTRSSFNSTICVLEGLLQYEAAGGAVAAVRDARLRGEEYLWKRRLFRSLSTGEAIAADRKGDSDFRQFSFPTRWHYDVLWGLDYLQRAGMQPDERVVEAVDLVRKKQRADGRWAVEHHHAGKVHFPMVGRPGTPSRWVTLRALRILKWFDGGPAPGREAAHALEVSGAVR
ncbi:MAG: hypothetical protein KC495_10410 [Dehalococcoidia bacterium]|nr:hypothetical protein [Dehalococcoidia bacterium]MCB9485362.1 hypothetical protein [Thermoflexaceae bacterium]